ncbi:MAG: glycosyltransferase [Anaerolineales bacterium]|nr:glycosyltransferase [Anaerolineales bacterium]
MKKATSNISVIICAYTEHRWVELLAAVESVQSQTVSPQEIIVVIDHNPLLLEQVRTALPDVISIHNHEDQGLSGARNSGLAVARGEIIAFLDEDATAAPDWLAKIVSCYADSAVAGVGGAIEPLWIGGQPKWFPEEFNWVVGCTYRGMPQTIAPVRNLIGCNMSLRHEIFQAVGGFRNGIGRIGTRPVGCEETELCIRTRQLHPQSELLYMPEARVEHRVPPNRANLKYFLSRCYAEGLSKALVARFVGTKDGLASERTYTLKVLPEGVVRGLTDFSTKLDLSGLGRAGAIIAGLSFATAGYLAGRGYDGYTFLQQQMADKLQINKKSALDGNALKADPEAQDFCPAQLLEIELTQPLAHIPTFNPKTEQNYRRAVALVRLHHRPVGVTGLKLDPDGLTAQDCARQIWEQMEPQINAHLRQDGLSPVTELRSAGLASANSIPVCSHQYNEFLKKAPFVSVIIATHNRTESLAACLDSLLGVDYPHYEIIVVDNAPSNDETANFIRRTFGESTLVRYVREDRPGLAVAHNCGLKQAKGTIVAFTDDDVLVDKYWLTEIVKGFFVADNVGCVTGMIFPAEMETPAQMWIEQYGGFNKGFERQLFDLHHHRPGNLLYPYTAGMFGSGANMAFKTAVLQEMGGFDPALGAGSKGVGGDDLAAFFDVVSRGYTLVYEPAAIVHHWDRRDYAGLRKQAYGYGVGLMAFLTKTVVDKPSRALEILIRLPSGLKYIFSAQSPKNQKKQASYPKELTKIERQGMLFGPIAYLRSRWQVRKLDRHFGLLEEVTPHPPASTSLIDRVF